MNTRRSFLGKVAGAAATVAVAPWLALKAKPYWIQDQCHSRCFDDEYTCVMQGKPMVLQSEKWSQEWWFDLKSRRLPDGTVEDYYEMSPVNFEPDNYEHLNS